MSGKELDPGRPPDHTNYLTANYGVWSWLLTRDHKRIALLYLASITVMFFVGGAFAVGIRLELVTPPGDLMSSELYNKFFTMHGVMMVFFFLLPGIPGVLGNFLIPLMIGAKDMAFPRINLASWYLYTIGAIFALWAMVNGGIDTGWTFYTPYSTVFSNTQVIATGLGIFIAGFSSILTGLNSIVTIHKMRAPRSHLVPPAAIHLGPLRDQHHHDPRHAGTGDHIAARRARARPAPRLLRSQSRWRPDPLPAPFLVLLAPGGVHHGAAGYGRDERARHGVHAQARFRLLGHRRVKPRDRSDRLPGLGSPPVPLGPVHVRRHGVLGALLRRRDPVGDQGLQLDGHALQGLDLLGHADALRHRLHRASSRSAGSRVCSWQRSAWTSTCTTPTSSSRTSTTSWSAAR